jgi:hypothetical protein
MYCSTVPCGAPQQPNRGYEFLDSHLVLCDNDQVNSNSGWGKSVIWVLLLWAVLGGLIAYNNQDEFEQSVGLFLVWPIFLFITPPGWMILAVLSRQGQPSPTEIHFANEQKTESLNEERDISEESPLLTTSLTRDGLTSDSLFTNQYLDTSKSIDSINNPFDLPIDNSSERANSNSDVEQASRRELASRFGWICQLCREPIIDLGWTNQRHNPQGLAVDLIVPMGHGGSFELSNLQPVHASCKWAKGGRLVSNHHFHREIVIKKLTSELTERQPKKAQTYSPLPVPKTPTTKYEWFEKVYPEPRLGEWVSPHRVINSLLKELQRSSLSPEQEERARDFLMAEHNQDLMKNCQRGHALTLENTYFTLPADGGIQRQCRECGRERKRQSRY